MSLDCLIRGLTYVVIVGELCPRQQFGPIFLVGINICPKILLEYLIDPFRLTVSLRMVSRRSEKCRQ